MAAAQAAWQSHGEMALQQNPSLGAGKGLSGVMLPPATAAAESAPQPAGVRLSAKLDAAGRADLAGGGLRADLEQALGGNAVRLEAAVRPRLRAPRRGCAPAAGAAAV